MSQCPIEGILANSVDPDQKPQNAASDQALYCLFEIQILSIKYDNDNNNNNKNNYIKKTSLLREMDPSKELCRRV